MMGRFVLPWFGGGPSVWTECLLFFQAALLGGYLYAHWVGRLSGRTQAILHTLLLTASLAFLPLAAHIQFFRPESEGRPALRILLLLAATCGVPYLALASTAPLVQRWFHLSRGGKPPWRLYALSNLASFAALLSYPFLVEPLLRLHTQALIWSGVYAAFMVASLVIVWRLQSPAETQVAAGGSNPVWLWLALSAVGSMLLMATTSQISQEVAVVPFLWVAPLAMYLLTFVLAFAGWYQRTSLAIMAGVLTAVACAVLAAAIAVPVWAQIAVDLAALFVACMVCQGELVRSKPAPEHLTAFYLTIAAGGTLGGALTALVAPSVFTEFTEYPLALAGACLLAIAAWVREGALNQWTGLNFAVRIPMMALLAGGLTAAATAVANKQPGLLTVRNFYGILRVSESRDALGRTVRTLTHGRIKHGSQILGTDSRRQPTTYYGPHSGVALALQAIEKQDPQKPLRIGVIGLGAGTLAAWGRAGDTFRFYEINPAVADIAWQRFTYLADSPAHIEVTLGDARVTMERELASGAHNDFDAIVVDAFSGDSIPIHLLTVECGRLYRERLAPGGALLLHISNRSLNLEPVARGLAASMSQAALITTTPNNPETGEDSATWALIGPNTLASAMAPALTWTDDFASLWHVLK